MIAFPRGIVAVVRTATQAQAETTVEGLSTGGVEHIEVTTSVPNYRAVVRSLIAAGHPSVGVGTVLDVAAVEAAAQAGAHFVVAPDTNAEVVRAAVSNGLPMAAGAMTPTEIRRAFDLGSTVVKVFPISSVGGVRFVRDIAGPLPHIPLIVSGGIDVSSVSDYLRAGTHAVCLGGALIDQAAVDAGDVESVAAHCRSVLQTCVSDS